MAEKTDNAATAPLTKRLLQGRPLGHPLHPMLVHLPIGLWMLSFVLDLIALASEGSNETSLVRGAFYTLATGLVFAVVAMVTGFADYTDIRKDHPAKRTATWHMVLNLVAAAVFALSALLRVNETQAAILPIVVSGLGVVLINVSGYLGGVMVYDDGIAAGRHRRTHEIHKTEKVDAAPDDGFVEALDSDELPESFPVRAEVNGHVMTLVRLSGQIYAFQEFCTHRCGPLSEGRIDDDKIMCPWHRSCFDVRTGRVTNGPAKVDLRTYPTREERGRISVSIPS